MVLGVQWLSTLGAITRDFKDLLMAFMCGSEMMLLKSIPLGKLRVVEGEPSAKMFTIAVQVCLLQVVDASLMSIKVDQSTTMNYPKFLKLKDKLRSFFEDPIKLPPSRGVIDHRVPLEESKGPVNIRPYRYPLKQRDVIEQLIQEMLDRGIIQNSCSPFSSPMVLVGKKDGTWRLCIDYREINRRTKKK